MSNYRGYLLKVGNYTIPNSLLKQNTFTIKPEQRLDLDSYRDTTGTLIRSVVYNRPPSVTVETISMTETQLRTLLSSIQANFTNTDERKCSLTYFDTEKGVYVTHSCYMPDLECTIYRTDDRSGHYEIYYNPVKLEFIGY